MAVVAISTGAKVGCSSDYKSDGEYWTVQELRVQVDDV
jgi:hypothetical protein